MKKVNKSKRLASLLLSLLLIVASVCCFTACGKKITGIEIASAPDKTKYMAGETFDATGMIVKANYEKGESEEITDYTYDLTSPLKETDDKVTVSYEGFTATVSIKVSNPVTGIVIKTHATKTAYKSGEKFDPAGMVLTITYYDNSTKDVAFADLGATYSQETLRVGQTEVEIKYEGITAKETITVTRGSYIETAVDNEFSSAKANKVVFVYGSNGFSCHEEVYINNGTTGPATGYKGFDQVDRWASYTFELKEDSKVDFVWRVAGSDWVGSASENPGVDDLANYFTITLDEYFIDVNGIVLPGGSQELNNVWWNTQSLVIKDVELKKGVHTFKAVCHGGSGLNVDSMTVYSDSAFAVEKTVSISSANITEKEGKAFLIVKGTYSGYEEKDFSINLAKLADETSISLTSAVTLKEGGLFEIEADLSSVDVGLGDLIAKLEVGGKVLDLEFSGSEDGTVGHLTLSSKSYTLRYESSKTDNKPILILTVDSAFDAVVDNEFTSSKKNSLLLNYYSKGTVTNGQLSAKTDAPLGGIESLSYEEEFVSYTFSLKKDGLVDLVLRVSGCKWDTSKPNNNRGAADLGKTAVITIDGTSIGVNGIDLPAGDGETTSVWWNMKSIVLKNLELSKGEHIFRIQFQHVDGANVGDLTVYSDSEFNEIKEYSSSIEKASLSESDKSDKTNKLSFVWGSNGFERHEDVADNASGATGPKTGIKSIDRLGRWATFAFTLEEEATVDLIWQVAGSYSSSGSNEGVDDLFCNMIVTLDGTPIDLRGYALPAGDNETDDTKLWWNVYDIIVKDLTLSAGVHVFKAECMVTKGGVNMSFLNVYSDKKLVEWSGAKAERTEVGSYETTNENEKTYVYGSDGLNCHEDVYINNGTTGPKTGIKGLDNAGRWISYTFTLTEDSVVDLIWQIAGSRWVGSVENNPGVDDLSKYMIVYIDGKAIDLRGIALPGGTLEENNVWWDLYDVVVKNLSLSAGEHTFKAVSLGTAGVNISSMTVTSSTAFAE